ncbi:MAG: hypothetical protein WC352_08230 [Candidatus Omnitrophota bacterium]|jgi:hypothetical protein
MSKKLTIILAVMVLGMFLPGTLPAYAGPGLRAVRAAILAKKAEDKLTENPEKKKEQPNAELGQSNTTGYADTASKQPIDEQPPQEKPRRRRLLPLGD